MSRAEDRAFYDSARWRRTRRQVIARDRGLCVLCRKRGQLTPAKAVDHIKPLSKYPNLALVLSNLQSLCQTCHTRKTKGEQRPALEICAHGYPEGVCCIGDVKIPD